MAVLGTVNYHHRTGGRQAYHIDPDGVSGRLTSPEHLISEVSVVDARDPHHEVRFDIDGIGWLEQATTVPTFTTSEDWKAPYEAELTSLLRRQLNAIDVRVFDHTIREDDPEAIRRPARNVHTDYSAEGAHARLQSLIDPTEIEAWRAGHFAFVNVWRPLSDVVRSAPLGFVRPRSVEPNDWLVLDLVYPDRIGQILGLHANPNHEWVYISHMTRDELVFFNIYDNQGLPAVAHSAIDLSGPAPTSVRRSLESRTLVRYAH